MTDLNYSWAEPDDLGEVEAFLIAQYGRDSIQAQPGRCEWLFFRNPYGLHVSLCRHGAELVGVCGHLPLPVSLAGRSILAGFGMDFMVDPRWRRHGIARRMLEMRLERFTLSLSTGQSDTMASVYAAVGARPLGVFSEAVFRSRPPTRGGTRDLAKGWFIWGRGLFGRKPGSRWTLQPAQAPAGADETAAWSAWRFQDGPYRDYDGWEVRSDGDYQGTVTSRREADRVHLVHVSTVQERMTDVVATVARSLACGELRILFAGDLHRNAFRHAGFTIRPQASRLIGLTTDPELRKALIPGALNVFAGASDADLIRMIDGNTDGR